VDRSRSTLALLECYVSSLSFLLCRTFHLATRYTCKYIYGSLPFSRRSFPSLHPVLDLVLRSIHRLCITHFTLLTVLRLATSSGTDPSPLFHHSNSSSLSGHRSIVARSSLSLSCRLHHYVHLNGGSESNCEKARSFVICQLFLCPPLMHKPKDQHLTLSPTRLPTGWLTNTH
jgi:hypothetical protein